MKIGPYSFDNQVILAPMAGVTDLPYREICREHGAGAVVGEMLTSNQKLWNSSKSSFRQIQTNESGVRWIQILGNDPAQMAEAAKACEQKGAHIIDINMGCPAKKVCKKAAGSALLQDESLVQQILEHVVAAVDIPVTLKIRSGWDKENKNALRIGHIAQNSGIAALSIHGRTRRCKYTELAEYDTCSLLKQHLGLPIIVNGDIVSPQIAKTVLDQCQADGIMIGRAALGNPWLFKQIDRYINHNEVIATPSIKALHETISKHIHTLHKFYGPYLGVRIARKHLSWYENNFPDHLHIKSEFNQLTHSKEQIALIDRFFERRIN